MAQFLCFKFPLNPLRFVSHERNLDKTSPKRFSASKCDVGNWIFSKSWEFFGTFLEYLWEFFGVFADFLGNFLGNVLEFFGNSKCQLITKSYLIEYGRN